MQWRRTLLSFHSAQEGRVFLVTFPELEEFAQYDVTEEQEAEMEAAQKQLAQDNVSIASLQIDGEWYDVITRIN